MGEEDQQPQDPSLSEFPDAGAPVPDPSADPWIGQVLTSYQIIQRIGEGGMGIVYLARHLSLDRLAAVKFLGAHMVNDKAYIERFLNEARGAARLNHPNIVAVYDAGAVGEDVYYFIMEYIEGRDLGSMVREIGCFPINDSVGYVRQAAQALGYAHKKHIVHRDIKPDNLMLTTEGVIKVGDLGLAKWTGDEMGAGMTQTGVVMGTPYYMSPEQVRGSKDVDGRSDIYSLGGTLHHLITGKIPYDGSSPAVIMAMHLNSPVPEPQKAHPNVDADISAIIRKMMAKDPKQRYQNMEEVDQALRQYESKPSHPKIPSPEGVDVPPPWAAPAAAPLHRSGLQLKQPVGAPSSSHPYPSPPGSPVTVIQESGGATKTGLIIGLSIIIAALIIGYFASHILKNEPVEQTFKPPVVKPPEPASATPSSPKPPSMASSKPAEPGTVPPPPVEKPKEPEKPKLSEPVQVASARPVLPPPAETPRPLPRPGGRRQFDVLSPEGVVREGPPDFVLAMVNRLMPAVLQDFGKADPGKLPGGTQVFYWQPSGDCILVDPKGTQVDKAKLSWRLFADEMEDGKNFLQLSLDGIPTNANHLAIRFETPSLEPQQPYFLGIMLRAADKPVKAKITLEPTFLSYQQLDVPTHWRLFMLLVPPEHPDSRAVMVGFNTPGKVDIGEIRLAPLPQGFRPPPRGPNGNQNYQGNDSGNPGMNGGDPLGGQPPYFQGPRQPNNRRR